MSKTCTILNRRSCGTAAVSLLAIGLLTGCPAAEPYRAQLVVKGFSYLDPANLETGFSEFSTDFYYDGEAAEPPEVDFYVVISKDDGTKRLGKEIDGFLSEVARAANSTEEDLSLTVMNQFYLVTEPTRSVREGTVLELFNKNEFDLAQILADTADGGTLVPSGTVTLHADHD